LVASDAVDGTRRKQSVFHFGTTGRCSKQNGKTAPKYGYCQRAHVFLDTVDGLLAPGIARPREFLRSRLFGNCTARYGHPTRYPARH
jgi:hypothetical protein